MQHSNKKQFLLAILLVFILVACSSTAEPDPTATTAAVGSATATETVVEEVVEPTAEPTAVPTEVPVETSAEASTDATTSDDADTTSSEDEVMDDVSAESGDGDGSPSEDDGEGSDDVAAASEETEGEAEEDAEMIEEQTIIRTFTSGIAQNSYAGEVTSACTTGVTYRTGNMGEVTDDDGNVWIVPADVAGGFTNVEVYNDCFGDGDNADFESELVTQVIDEGGTEITGYIFADNYYEMYVNGTFTGRDSVNFTTFNSHAVKFQAEYPITYAFLLVDWEEYNGVGMEELRGYHAGDGGFIASFSDGASTNDDWVCKPFYIAPLDDGGSCVVIDENGNADASACASSDDAISCIASDPEGSCSAYHETVPNGWISPDFDDSTWPAATRYVADDITNQVGFRNYEDTLFADTNFIWSSNLVLDNSVICRMTVEGP